MRETGHIVNEMKQTPRTGVDDAPLAWTVAYFAHEDDRRKVTGAPYLSHSEKVADRIRDILPDDTDTYAMAILHDVLDVGSARERVGGPEGLCRILGEKAVHWADGVVAMTKDRTIEDSKERSSEMLKRCIDTHDWRVWLVEIVDKWATVDDLPGEIEEYGLENVEDKFQGGFEQYVSWAEQVRDTIAGAVQEDTTIDEEAKGLITRELEILSASIKKLKNTLVASELPQSA